MTNPLLTPAAETLAQSICGAIGAHEKDDLISALVSILAAAINDHPDVQTRREAEATAEAVCDVIMDMVEAGDAGRLAHGSRQ